MISKEIITEEFKSLQDSICEAVQDCDGIAEFKEDRWAREEGGGGISRIIENGDLIEKGGVNFSSVWGSVPEHSRHSFGNKAGQFYAAGVSIVLHPQNPFVPIIHMNVRYFEMDDGTWWFGGGIDLSPHYIDKGEAALFHEKLRKVCMDHHPDYYHKFKAWADDYFFVKHRNETRGIGGIFFDRLSGPGTKENIFDFTLDLGKNFAPIYIDLANKKRGYHFTDEQRQWQLLRRGRYVEFNLVLDRGTKFGLETNGRIESILMSLPPTASWKYNFTPKEGSPEWCTQQLLKKNIDWINA
jgi:coproporphyrinogen III oxidase